MNSIINQNLGGNNSMEPLAFFWIAIFRDGSKIEQFNEDGSENRYQLVKDNLFNLAYLNLTDRKGHLFTVDLINGRIGYNYLVLPYLEKTEKENIRPIYFRRHRVTITETKKTHTIEYHLGLQWNDKFGYNRKTILKIDENGNWILGD